MCRDSHGRAGLRSAAILLFLAAALLAATAAPAHAGPGFLKGIWGPIKFPAGEAGCDGPQRCSAIPIYQQLGADVFQYQLQWNEIAPSRPANPSNPNDPAYRWHPELTLAVNEAAARGMQVAFLIKGSPPWANGGRSWNWAPNAQDYANFAYAAARRFPSVRIWQIWGEPTRENNFMPQGREGAQLYAKLLDAAYFALKDANENVVVVGGSTFFGGFTRPPRWIQYMRLPNGRPPHMDWFGHNPFEERFPNINAGPIKDFRGLSDVDTLWREVNAAYRKRVRRRAPKRCRENRSFARSHRRYCVRLKCRRARYRRRHPRRCVRKAWVYRSGRPTKLWLSEWSIQTDRGSYVFPYYVSRSEQVEYLRAAFALARSLPYVQGMGWYQLIDYPPSGNSPTWGLLEYDGDRKPVFSAYQQLP